MFTPTLLKKVPLRRVNADKYEDSVIIIQGNEFFNVEPDLISLTDRMIIKDYLSILLFNDRPDIPEHRIAGPPPKSVRLSKDEREQLRIMIDRRSMASDSQVKLPSCTHRNY